MIRKSLLMLLALGTSFGLGCGDSGNPAGTTEDGEGERSGNEQVVADDERDEIDTPSGNDEVQESDTNAVEGAGQAEVEEEPEVLAYLDEKGWEPYVADSGMKYVKPYNRLNFNLPVKLEPSDYQTIGMSKTIEELDLTNVELDAEGVAMLAGMEKLKVLDLQGESVRDDVLAAVARIKTLESVDVAYAENATDDGFVKLAILPRLTSLRLAYSKIGPAAMSAFADVPLTKLTLSNVDGLTDEVARQVAKIDTIEELVLLERRFGGDRKLTREGVRAIAESFVPRKFWFDIKHLDDDVLRRLLADGWLPTRDEATSKETLTTIAMEDTAVTDEGFSVLLDCPNVTSLWLGTTKLTDASLSRFPEAFPKLESISIDEAEFTATGFDALAKLPVRILKLTKSNLTEESLVAIGKMKALETLKLEECQYEAAWLKHLAGLENLTDLNLEMSPFDDTAATHVAKLPKLEEIDVSGSQLGDTGFLELVAVPQLKDLWIGETKVTADVYEKAKADNPEKSIHD